MKWLIVLLALSLPSSAQLTRVIISNNTGVELRGYITLSGVGTQVTRGSFIGTPAPNGAGYYWDLPSVTPDYPSAVIEASFGPGIVCSLPYDPHTNPLFFLHFIKTEFAYGCTITKSKT